MPDVRPATIMIVDDTPENLTLLGDALAARGHRVQAFPTAGSALSAAQRRPPDLLLLDVCMPGMDGYDVCQRFKASELLRDIPVLFLSALSEPLDKIRAFDMGAVDFIVKPFSIPEVHARVETHLRLGQLAADLKATSAELAAARAELAALTAASVDGESAR